MAGPLLCSPVTAKVSGMPTMTLTCHGFKPHQEADQAGEADPADTVAVPEGHQMQQLTTDKDPSEEVWGHR